MKNEIGTDPTLVDVIETLDVPEENKQKENNSNENKPKKKTSFIKNFLFILLILILMGGVAFGVYYYLRLAKNNDNANNTNENLFILSNMESYVNGTISQNINDYGNFSKVDITSCILDVSKVDITKEGEYTYFVTCNNEKKSGVYKVILKEQTKLLNVKTNLIYVTKGNEVNAQRLVTSTENYTYTFENTDEVSAALNESGIHGINIKVADLENNENIVTSFVYVLDSEPKMIFSCVSPNEMVTDKIVFNNDKENMNASIRMFKHKYDTKEEYENAIRTINDGILTIDDTKGYAILDYDNNEITLAQLLTTDILDKEYNGSFPKSYSMISNYYRNTQKYTCSLS